MSTEVISKVVRIQEPGVRIIEKRTGFELEFHSEFWILSSEFLQNASFAIGSTNYTNEYFAVNLILRHKIKLTAIASVLLVPISAIRG